MKNHTRKELIRRSVLVVALVAVGISGTGLLLSFPIPTILGNTPQLVSSAYGASDSVFGDATTSTTTDNNNDNPEDDSTNSNKDQNNEKEQTSEETTTTSSSNIAPQISSSSDKSQVSESSSDDSTTSSPKIYNASMIGIKKDKSYDPNPININAGDSVVWTNSDNDIHSVTSGSDEGPSIGQEFDSGIVGAGKSFTHKFENLGTYEYFCSIHPSMVGEVIVK
ncbi:MAG: plastocyanin/azurin family copper-binding protein [Thermoproteota archaeon]|nr:plastocyanin/azurin family copper-binding protein [Thermoproteota archaeon]